MVMADGTFRVSSSTSFFILSVSQAGSSEQSCGHICWFFLLPLRSAVEPIYWDFHFNYYAFQLHNFYFVPFL
jgi:hypothetical protein